MCLSPGMVVCTHCSGVMLSQSFLFLLPHPLSLSHCPSGGGWCPSEGPADPPLLTPALLEVVSAEFPGVGLAVGKLVAEPTGAPVPVKVCVMEICASALEFTFQSCLMCFSPPSKAHGCIFFLFLAFSSVFSLSFPFFPSLSFSFFFFCFSSRKSKRGKGKGQKRKRKKGRYKPLSFHCEPCSERRKHLFVQDPQTCKCSCKFTDSRCKSRQLELNERTCRCEKPRR
uniref:Vascular endothelial growth factor heparin-binding domain-containing protein n=1 Tax=Malurus cyaneus samueli TaxID=2593467 RepID=A0A8C5UGD6_9PASS